MDLDHGLFIGGQWRAASDGGVLPVVNPASEEEIGSVAVATPQDLEAALTASERGFVLWRRVPAVERSACLRRIAEGIRRGADGIARQITLEQGKPLVEARAEVLASAEQFDWNAEEARRIYGHVPGGLAANVRYEVRWSPLGVVAAFTAWNFPALLAARKLSAALAAGCSVLIKPSEEAPGAVCEIARIAHEAGLPSGVLNVVTGRPAEISSSLLASSRVRKLTFTGSVPVGKLLMQQAAASLTKVSLELGGHSPVLVMGDADPDAAAQACVRAKFRNAGQVCISPSRIFVHRAIAASFTDAFVAASDALRVGDGLESEVEMGPLSNLRRVQTARELVADALAGGAKLLAGGGPPASQTRGYFFAPTVLADVSPDARILHEEPFVPVAPILEFEDFDEVLEQANALPFGLAAYVLTRDLNLAERAAEGLEAGMVGINDFALATAEAPFGGIKESGIGRESGALGIREFLESKTIKTVFQS
ncbi:MAG: NAD-dependent succinate-semialdehyde dehydrogenase [bacterium]|nr:NAD-dependent succinate-semialdehyde dehydrogenase [bacterium]